MIIITTKSLLGEIANWSIRQSPYIYPEGLSVVLHKMKLTSMAFDDILGCITFKDYQCLLDFLYNNFLTIEEVKKWNEPRNQHGKNVFVSRHNQLNPDDDFIDLDALARNIAQALKKESDEI